MLLKEAEGKDMMCLVRVRVLAGCRVRVCWVNCLNKAYMCARVGTSVRCGCHRFCCVDTGSGSLFCFLFCAPCFALVTSAKLALPLDIESSAIMTCLRYLAGML